jgi:hypothetical protein
MQGCARANRLSSGLNRSANSNRLDFAEALAFLSATEHQIDMSG